MKLIFLFFITFFNFSCTEYNRKSSKNYKPINKNILGGTFESDGRIGRKGSEVLDVRSHEDELQTREIDDDFDMSEPKIEELVQLGQIKDDITDSDDNQGNKKRASEIDKRDKKVKVKSKGIKDMSIKELEKYTKEKRAKYDLFRSLLLLEPESRKLVEEKCLKKHLKDAMFKDAFCASSDDLLKYVKWHTKPANATRQLMHLWHTILCNRAILFRKECPKKDNCFCPVDGSWSRWSKWSKCDAECGGIGRRKRKRYCDNPKPENGGLHCVGRSVKSEICVYKGCTLKEIAKQLEKGENFGESEKLALQIMRNAVESYPNLNEACLKNHCNYRYLKSVVGNNTIDSVWVSLHCLKHKTTCPLIGGWGEWSNWTKCAQTCEIVRTTYRWRDCDDPSPNFPIPGTECKGIRLQIKNCTVVPPSCRKKEYPGEWYKWCDWSPCGVDRDPTGKFYIKQRVRTCMKRVERIKEKKGRKRRRISIWSGKEDFENDNNLENKKLQDVSKEIIEKRRRKTDNDISFSKNAKLHNENRRDNKQRTRHENYFVEDLKRHLTERNLINRNVSPYFVSLESNVNLYESVLKPVENDYDGFKKRYTGGNLKVLELLRNPRNKLDFGKGSYFFPSMNNSPYNIALEDLTDENNEVSFEKQDYLTRIRKATKIWESMGKLQKMLSKFTWYQDHCVDENVDILTNLDENTTYPICYFHPQCNLLGHESCESSFKEESLCIPKMDLTMIGEWDEWGDWSSCSSVCGLGVHSRDRICLSGPPPAVPMYDSMKTEMPFKCKGDGISGSEIEYCFERPCAMESRFFIKFDANDSSWLEYKPIGIPTALLQMYIRLKFTSDDGIIAHRYRKHCQDEIGCDSVKIYLEDGFITMQANMNNCSAVVQTNIPLELDEWHEIVAAIMGQQVVMRIDNHETLIRKRFNCTIKSSSNFDMEMVLGSDKNHQNGFQGSVSDLAVNFLKYNLEPDLTWAGGGLPFVSQNVEKVTVKADDMYIALDEDDFLTAQCTSSGNGTFEFVISFQIGKHGVLMFTRGVKKGSLLYLKTDNNGFHLCLQLKSESDCLSSTRKAELKRWYRIKLILDGKLMTMFVNYVHKTVKQQAFEFKLCRRALFIGGGPPKTLDILKESNGFSGQIATFRINGEHPYYDDISVKKWNGMVSSHIISVADHYTETIYERNHTPALTCDYSKAYSNVISYNRSKVKVRWIMFDLEIDKDIGEVHNRHSLSFLEFKNYNPEAAGFYGCLISTPGRTWLLHAYGISFRSKMNPKMELFGESYILILVSAISLLLILICIVLIILSRYKKFGLYPGLKRMFLGKKLTKDDMMEYIQLQSGEFVPLTGTRRLRLRPSKRALLVSKSKRKLVKPEKTKELTRRQMKDYFYDSPKQVRFAKELDLSETPSGQFYQYTPSGIEVRATPSGRVMTKFGVQLGTGAKVSRKGQILKYKELYPDEDAQTDREEQMDTSTEGSIPPTPHTELSE